VAQPRFRGDRLAEARRQHGLSQADLANAISAAGRERISQWERGYEQPHPRLLREVADVLGIDPRELLDVDEDAQTLRDIRIAAGLSLRDAQQAAGLPYTTYYRLEAGVGARAPTQQVIAGVAKALGVSQRVVRSAVARTREERRNPQ
jgi:transcriptional regulator with XRE-family HTH domain